MRSQRFHMVGFGGWWHRSCDAFRVMGSRLVLGLLLLAGCGVSPVPEPPLVERSKIHLESAGMGLTRIRGDADSISPPGAVVTVLNLDTADPPSMVPSNADGSFEVVVTGEPFNEYRITATDPMEMETSPPIDVVGAPDGTTLPAPRPLEECLLFSETSIDFGEIAPDDVSVGQVRIENQCPEPVFIDLVSPRVGIDFQPIPIRMGTIIDTGAARNVPVQFVPGDPTGMMLPPPPGPREDVIFVQVSGMGGVTGRRTFDVRGVVLP